MTALLNYLTYDRLNKPTSMSIDAADAVLDADVQALANAIDAVIRGTALRATKSVVTVIDAGTAGPSSDNEANRGSKWLFRIQDATTGTIYTHEIGTADGGALPSANDDFLDLTAVPGSTLKTALEAVYQSPDGNAGTLLSVQQVNRALN